MNMVFEICYKAFLLSKYGESITNGFKIEFINSDILFMTILETQIKQLRLDFKTII